MDIVEKLEERAKSYEQSGPSAHHTASLLREAKFEIERKMPTREQIAYIIQEKKQGFAISLDLALEMADAILAKTRS